MLLDTAFSKMLMGNGGFVLGFIFLGLGLSFYLCKKMTGGPPPPRACVLPQVPQSGVTPFSLPTELLSHQRPQPLPVASGPARTPSSVPTLILGGSCFHPSTAVTAPARGSVLNKASQFALVLFLGEQWGGTWGG